MQGRIISFPDCDNVQSYKPSCSQTSTRKSTISGRGMGWGNGLFVPSRVSYVAFQLNLGSRIFGWLRDFLSPTHCCLIWFQRRRPLLTNSEGLLVLPLPPWGSGFWLEVLIDEMLLCDWTALLSISYGLLLQKSSERLDFLTARPCIFNPFVGSSTAIISWGLVQHPRQPLLPCMQRLMTPKVAFTGRTTKTVTNPDATLLFWRDHHTTLNKYEWFFFFSGFFIGIFVW